MLSPLSPEAAKLFSLLSAQDWQHKDPNLNSFMKRLISDKDSQRAPGIMQTQTKKWSGQVSDKGLMDSSPRDTMQETSTNNLEDSPSSCSDLSPSTAPNHKKTFTGKSKLCLENWSLTTRPSGTTPPTTSSWPIS
jgi:hypothetical protein